MRTKKQYVTAIQGLMTGVPRALIEEVLKAQEIVVGRTLGTGKPSDRVITVPGVVKLMARLQEAKPERRARNPATGHMMVIRAQPAHIKIKARFPVTLKRAVGEKLYIPKPAMVEKPRRLSRYERPPVI
jgi:hypothetical protein